MKNLKIAIIGTGALGTALAYLLLKNKNQISVFEPNPDNLHFFLTHRQIKKYSSKITVCKSTKECITKDFDIIMPCIPSKYINSFYKEFLPTNNKSSHIISISKGLYPNTIQTISQYVKLPKFSVLSGPTFANEILDNMPTACTVATKYKKDFDVISKIFNTNFFTCHYSQNLTATELGGILKNCYAITLGIIDHQFEMNSKSLGILQILKEAQTLYQKLKLPTTEIYSLSLLGDLIATGLNPASRNAAFGFSLKYQKNTTIEGADNITPILKFATKYKIKLPILSQTNQIILKPSLNNFSKLSKILLA